MRTRMTWNGDRAADDIDAAIMDGLEDSAEFLLGESRALVPIEEATLERSGVASSDRSRMAAAVSYNTAYAPRQHEELTWRHAPGRTAKYLEIPWLAGRAVFARLIQAAVRKVTR